MVKSVQKIGKDISIITFDGPVVEYLTNPSLSAVTHPRKALGLKAIEILLDMDKKNFKPQSFLAKPQIIDRGTVNKVS